jgi:hypothetical protein
MRLEDSHRLIVDADPDESIPIPDLTFHAGPLASLDTVLSYQKDGRYFVGQALTEDLPYVFELVPAKETTLEMIVPTNDNKPS